VRELTGSHCGKCHRNWDARTQKRECPHGQIRGMDEIAAQSGLELLGAYVRLKNAVHESACRVSAVGPEGMVQLTGKVGWYRPEMLVPAGSKRG
jgi:hypothetical protein